MRSLKNLKWVILFIFLLLIFLCAVKFYPATNYTYQIRVDLKKLQLTLKECDTGREIYCFLTKINEKEKQWNILGFFFLFSSDATLHPSCLLFPLPQQPGQRS